MHEMNCPNKNTSNVKVCSFDATHKVHASQIASHEKNCPKRPKHDQDTLKEMEMFIESQNKIKKTASFVPNNNNNNINISVNSINSTNKTDKITNVQEEKKERNEDVVGMRKTKEKMKLIEEEKNIKKLI